MSELIFSFLGPVRLSHPQLGEITITKRKALALLTYLVIEVDHAHTRESILGLLWPEDSTAAAQNSLRVTWSQLQKYLEKAREDAQPYLISNRLDLQFNPLSRYDLDVNLFRNLIEACRTHVHPGQPQDCVECAGRLAQAMTLVRGPFLDGFSLPDCPAFDEWLLLQRERLHLQMIAALEQLRRHALANGVDDLQYLDGREVLALESEVQAVAGLLSPSTGIIDSHALMLALLGDAERLRLGGAGFVDRPCAGGAERGAMRRAAAWTGAAAVISESGRLERDWMAATPTAAPNKAPAMGPKIMGNSPPIPGNSLTIRPNNSPRSAPLPISQR